MVQSETRLLGAPSYGWTPDALPLTAKRLLGRGSLTFWSLVALAAGLLALGLPLGMSASKLLHALHGNTSRETGHTRPREDELTQNRSTRARSHLSPEQRLDAWRMTPTKQQNLMKYRTTQTSCVSGF